MQNRINRIKSYIIKSSHTDNKEVNRLMETWLEKFGTSILTIIFLIVLSEIIYGLIVNIAGIEDKSWSEYMIFYVVKPGLTSIAMLIFWRIVVKRVKSYYFKAMATMFTLYVAFAAIVVANFDRVVFQPIVIVPMFICLIYEDKIIFNSTMILALTTHIASIIVIRLEHTSTQLPEFFAESSILSIIVIIIAAAFARLLLNFEIKKRKIESDEYISNVRLKNEVLYDELTRIYNYAGFKKNLGEQLANYRDGLDSMYLAILDIDYFKKVNDTYGHDMGNIVLRRLGSILLENENKSIIAARFGGEEFAILFLNMDTQDIVARLKFLADRFRSSKFEGIEKPITLSGGLAKYELGDSEESLFKKADKELYRAKNAGRDRVFSACDI